MIEFDTVVAYTDGSHVTAPNGTGGGIHAFMYNNLDPDQYYESGGAEAITSRGYKPANATVPRLPLPDNCVFSDCVIPVPADQWSDVGELVAFISLFEGAPFTAKNYYVYVDSSYVVNTYNEWIDGWAKRGWSRADGTPLGNLPLIQKIFEIKNRTAKEGRQVKVIKIKGHAGHYGNEKADLLARKASAMVASGEAVDYKPYWLDVETPPVIEKPTVDVDYSNVPAITTTKYCYPHVGEEHPTITVNGESWKFMLGGHHDKTSDDVVYVGKMVPDAQFAVFFSRTGWEATYEIVKLHADEAWKDTPLLNRYSPIAMTYNDHLKRKKFQEASKDGFPVEQLTFSPDKNVWMFEKTVISRILRPALLSYRVLDIRDELAGWLKLALEGNPTIVFSDITPLLYDEKNKPIKEFYRDSDKSFTCRVGYPNSEKTIPVILSRNIDLPSRVAMNKIMEGGKWYVVTRRPQERLVEYAVVYIGNEYHGLWCAYYANKRILKEDEI